MSLKKQATPAHVIVGSVLVIISLSLVLVNFFSLNLANLAALREISYSVCRRSTICKISFGVVAG
jgi:hypothetical protein